MPSDVPTEDEDFLNRALGGSGPTEVPASLHDFVRRQTSRRVRRRRSLRRLRWVPLLAACYLAGVATRGSFYRAQTEPPPAAVVQSNSEQRPANPQNAVAQLAPTAGTSQTAIAPVRASRFEVLRNQGDELLRDLEDPALAARKYRQALNIASDRERAIAPGDNWLLMALKDARDQEKRDETGTPN